MDQKLERIKVSKKGKLKSEIKFKARPFFPPHLALCFRIMILEGFRGSHGEPGIKSGMVG